MNNKKLILITNDDGYLAKGINSIIEAVKPLGHVVVVAPDKSQSGMSHAITLGDPLFLKKITQEEDFELYACSGTPADCIKIALHKVLDKQPDIIISGINHGSNAAVNALYSGTVAGATEGCFHNVPSIALSITAYEADADFTDAVKYGKRIIEKVLANGLPTGICLNVNVPSNIEVKGVRTCRMTPGRWVEEFEQRTSPHGQDYYWLTGEFHNDAPDDPSTDEWVLKNGYVSIVPIHNDITAFAAIAEIGNLEE